MSTNQDFQPSETVKAMLFFWVWMIFVNPILTIEFGRWPGAGIALGLVAIRIIWVGVQEGRKWWVCRKA